ncbi:PAS domain-containing sensor histidine kinase [Roseospira navarrensis]|uniref:histidine kinase n=1 Tax=Roseospira navarrensis TaxID=140058 RepID=A0A7X2D2Q5_9PROT|nr:PAS domain-containing sensor histidine kinase [Roseospira navarrensis]MQX35961.1 PAS domain-containing protein [Roseospira navarrensis]
MHIGSRNDGSAPPREGSHRLKDELYALVRKDPAVFEFLQNGSLDGMWYWDLDSPDDEWLSPRFKSLFGYADDEMPHTTAWWQSNIHPDDLAVVQANFEKHKADPAHPFDQIIRYRHREGHTVWVRCRGLMVRDPDGTPRRMLGAHTDVTALKQAEEALERRTADLEARIADLEDKEQRLETQAEELVTLAENLEDARARLEELNAQKDKFFSIVAHDLKSPFNPLLGFSELLAVQGGALPPAKVQEYGALLHRAATEAFKLLEDLLDWSRIQLDRVQFDPGAVDLVGLVETNLGRYRLAAQAKGVTLRADDLETLCAYGDPRMLDTVVRNLVSNAIKFTRDGDEIAFASRADGDVVVLEIRDTGVGIRADRLPTLFGLGSRQSSKGTGGETGTGMGLVICKELIERQGGTIAVESVAGQGTTFTLRLPSA